MTIPYIEYTPFVLLVLVALLETGLRHGPHYFFNTGDRVIISGNLPKGLKAGAQYFAIMDGPNTFRLATSKRNALAGIAIDLNAQEGDSKWNQNICLTRWTSGWGTSLRNAVKSLLRLVKR